MTAPTDIWYVYENGQQSGPFSEGDLRAFMAQGSISTAAMIYRAGMSEWAAITTVIPPQPRPASSAQMPPLPPSLGTEPGIVEEFERAMRTGSAVIPSRWRAYGVKVGRRSFILLNIIAIWTILIILWGAITAVGILSQSDPYFYSGPYYSGSLVGAKLTAVVSAWLPLGGIWLIVALPCGIAAVVVMEKRE